MAKRKKGKVIPKSGESLTLAEILSSDAVVRVISSHVLNVAVTGQIRTSGKVTFNLVVEATGQIIKTVSSVEGVVYSLSEEVLSDPALPPHALQLLKTSQGVDKLLSFIQIILSIIALYGAALTDQSIKQIAQALARIEQRLEQIVPSHSEQATPAPSLTKPRRSPSKPKTPASRKNQKSQAKRRTR